MNSFRIPGLILLLMLLCVSSCQLNASASSNSTTQEDPKRPDKIILLIGDGMGLTQITAGMLANGNQLHLESFPYIGLTKTRSFDNIITDSAAGATALAAGVKTYNGAIGVDSDTLAVESILELSARGGYSTGLIATSSITHATPASFYAHQPSRSMDEAIALDMLSAPVDIFIGGGRDFFMDREDGADLLDSLSAQGYKVYEETASISSAEEKVAALISRKQPQSILDGRADMLGEATEKALQFLEKEEQFFLMIEGSQIDWEGHGNNTEGIVAEMIDFDKAIGKVLDFAEKDGNTLVLVTADHETGGFSIVGEDEDGKLEGRFTTGGHTGDLIPIFAYGPGAEAFSGIYENTEVFEKMKGLLKNLDPESL